MSKGKLWIIGIIVLSVCIVGSTKVVQADEVLDEFDRDIKQAEKQIQEAKEKMQERKKQMEGLDVDKRELENEIERVEKVAEETHERIEDTNTDIENLTTRLNDLYIEIEELSSDLDNRKSSFRHRVTTSSEMNFDSYLDVLLEADSFSDLLSNLNFVRSSLRQDNEVIEEYVDTSKKLDDKKEQQEKYVKELENKKEDLKKIREQLEQENIENKEEKESVEGTYDKKLREYRNAQVKIEEKEKLIEDLKEQRKEWKEELERRRKEEERRKREAEKRRQEAAEQAENQSNSFSGSIGSTTGDYGLQSAVEYKRTQLIRLGKEAGLPVRTTSGLRTFAEQSRLYAKGRTAGGSIVTNAKAGQSWHNYGVAFDIAFTRGSGLDYREGIDRNGNGTEDWEEMGQLGESIGLEWGGRWTSIVDKPHFQYTMGKSKAEMRRAMGK